MSLYVSVMTAPAIVHVVDKAEFETMPSTEMEIR